MRPTDDQLRALLTQARTIAVVGASSDPDRPSYGIARKLLQVGYKVIPINPNEREVLGERAYPTLDDAPGPIDVVDVFRRPEHTPALADAAVRIGARLLWLQSGVVNPEAARRAEAGGVAVVMDECLGVIHSLLRVPRK